MTILQQNDLLSIFLANSYIDISDSISTCITSDNKNYAQVVATILAFKNDKRLCTNDLLRTIIFKHGRIDPDGRICSTIPSYNKYYEELKSLVKANELIAEQQNDLLSALIRRSEINRNDGAITANTILINRKHFKTLMLLLANNDKNLQINNSLKAFLKHCNLKFDGVCWFVIEPYDENYEEVRKLIEENMSNAQ